MRQGARDPLRDGEATSRRLFQRRPAPGSGGDVCRRPPSCSASLRRRRRCRLGGMADIAPVPLPPARDGWRGTRSPLILRIRRSGRTGGEGRARRLELAPLVEDFDALLRILETRVAEPRELHPALVELQRLFEGQLAILELLDDRFELRDRRFKILDSGSHHWPLRTSHSNSPSARVTRTRSPALTSADRRITV